MLTYDFMLRAFAASGVVALVAGTVGCFLVLRGQTFAGHALSHVGFAGATGAALIGVSPLAGHGRVHARSPASRWGSSRERLSGRDVAIGIVLALSPSASASSSSASTESTSLQATALLFGNVLAVSPANADYAPDSRRGDARRARVPVSRPLLFATLQPELAEARGVSPRSLGTLFLAVVALAVAQSVQIVGVLLVFALMVGPPAAAQLLTTRVIPGILLSAGLAVAEAWLGIVISWHTDWPTSFSIVIVSALVYFASAGAARRR